jgi:hypothetical protein
MEGAPLRLEPIADGRWAAHGPGWAVYAGTREAALATYRKLVAEHRDVLAPRPPAGPGHAAGRDAGRGRRAG